MCVCLVTEVDAAGGFVEGSASTECDLGPRLDLQGACECGRIVFRSSRMSSDWRREVGGGSWEA